MPRLRSGQTDFAGAPPALLECEDHEQRRTCTFLGASVSEEGPTGSKGSGAVPSSPGLRTPGVPEHSRKPEVTFSFLLHFLTEKNSVYLKGTKGVKEKVAILNS